MPPCFSRKVRSIEIVAIFAILTLLMGCSVSTNGYNGQSSNTSVSQVETPTNTVAPTTAMTPTATSGTSSTPSPLSINKGNVSVDADGLHIQATDGIECSPGYKLGHSPPNHLVLATSRTTYNSGEIQQITSYLDALSQTDETMPSIDSITTPLPASLTWASGASCSTTLEITNTGNSTIQIPQIDARLTAASQQNNYQYRLIDACSMLSADKCRCGGCGGAGGSCSVYAATIQLGVGQQDSVFSSTPTSMDTCGQMTLAPSSTLELYLSFSSSPPSNLMYSLTTELTLKTASGQQVLALPQLGSSVAFADNSQFSCYGLQNQTFVQINPDTTTSNCI